MALVTSIEQYNNILQIMPTENKEVYKILDSNQTIGLNTVWLMMVKDAKEANITRLSEYDEYKDDTGSNYSWSSC
tara:strand:+ start:286 stop:510 length:225 start_codon:yes stop_codon:yes gene_type:complete